LTSIAKAADATLADPADYRNPWGNLVSRPPQQEDLMAEPQFFFSGDGELAFLLCRPIKAAGSFTAALKPVAALREIVAEIKPRFGDVEIGLTGLPVLETDEMAAAERDTELVGDGRSAVGLSVGIPKRQLAKVGPKDDLDKLMDALDDLEI